MRLIFYCGSMAERVGLAINSSRIRITAAALPSATLQGKLFRHNVPLSPNSIIW